MIKVDKGYHKNGKLRYKFLLKDSIRHGEAIGFYDSGKVAYKAFYKDGKDHGINTFYCRNGKLALTEYHLYGIQVTKDEYREHELTEELSGIK